MPARSFQALLRRLGFRKKRLARRSNSRWRSGPVRAELLEPRHMLAGQLLPDMTPWADASKGFVYDWTIVGNDLRLTTAMANIGTGPLDLHGGATHPDGTQDVYQRIYSSDGTYT